MRSIYNLNRNREAALQISTNALLTAYSEKGETRLKFAWRWSTLDMQVEVFVAKTSFSTVTDKELYVSGTGVWYVLTGGD